MPWQQCSDLNPCPVCGRKRYCTFKPEGGIVKCTQVSDGSFSQKKDRAGMGFFHRHDFEDFKEAIVKKPEKSLKATLDWSSVSKASIFAPRHRLATLARKFGCTVGSLQKFEIGWLSRTQLFRLGTKCRDEGAWTFPMRDFDGTVIGYRLRTPSEDKFAIAGSSNGLFFKPPLTPGARLLIVDGASDAFTAHRYALHAVGRPSATGGQEVLKALLGDLRPSEVHQLLDADDPGNPVLLQARQMAQELLDMAPSGTIFYPPHPHKDLRQWLSTTASIPTRFTRLVNTSGRIVKNSNP